MNEQWIIPEWPAPKRVKSLITTRAGGQSQPPYDSFNLANHVKDHPLDVQANRQVLSRALHMDDDQFCWLSQVHGTVIVDAEHHTHDVEADGIDSSHSGQVCVVMTADCLPVLLTNQSGTKVSAVHAGWRGLAGGIIQKAVDRFDRNDPILAYLGPAIGPMNFEVGQDVFDVFTRQDPEMAACFKSKGQKYFADLYGLAKIALKTKGVQHIFGGEYCTYSDAERFYSFRRDGARSGRMASLIWLE